MMDGATRPSPLVPPRDGHRTRVAALVAAASIEISPRDELAGEKLRDLFAPGTTVFINHPASVTHHDIVAACAKLRRAGFTPIPHIAARRLASFTQANDFLRRAAGEAGGTAPVLIPVDPAIPAPPVPHTLAPLSDSVLA